MSDSLAVERLENVTVIRFNRPDIRSPLSISVLEELDRLIDESASQAFIFTGTNDVFASGADLREIASATPGNAKEFALRGQTLMTKIASLPKTTIAAINGYCFGGALDLALACDRRIASPNAKFAHPGAGLGIITGWGGTQRLPRIIGRANALELFFTAESIDASRALSIGLIDEIVEDPLARAVEAAE